MDNFEFGMFGDLQDYEDRREYEAWLDQQTSPLDQGEQDDHATQCTQ